MRTLITVIAFLSFWLFSSCGGGASNLNEGNNLSEQPQIADPGPAAPAPDVSMPYDQQPVDTPAPPEGSAEVFLTGNTMSNLELPPMDPDLLEPDDTELPRLWLANFAPGATLHGVVNLSVFSADNTGTNLIALYIGEDLVKFSESVSLQYEWNTWPLTDGEHELTFLVRDNGGNTGLCKVIIKIDSNRLWCVPDVFITKLTGTFDGIQYNATNLSRFFPPTHVYVTEDFEMEIEADCRSGIKQLELFTLPADATDWNEQVLVGHAGGGNLSVSLSTVGWEDEVRRGRPYFLRNATVKKFKAVAEDFDGNIKTYFVYLSKKTTSRVTFREDQAVKDLDVDYFLMPHGWTATEETDLALAVENREDGGVSLGSVSIGNQVVIAAHHVPTFWTDGSPSGWEIKYTVIPFICYPRYENIVGISSSMFE